MSLNVLVMPDKFKGTLTAMAAAEAIAEGWKRARPMDRLTVFPISDGGDGFGELIGRVLNAGMRWTDTVNAAHEPHRAAWWWNSATHTAIIESAQVIGLALLPPGKYHPFALDTFGLGALIQAAMRQGAKRVLIGIGGSATNDGGFGLARSLGWRFRDQEGQILEKWTQLSRLAHLDPPGLTTATSIAEPAGHHDTPPKSANTTRIDPAHPGIPPSWRQWHSISTGVALEVAVDVRNPLLGERGATRVYGPQKGLGEDDFGMAETCLRRLAEMAGTQFGQDFSREPGAGAAGGLGFGLRAFVGATLKPGFDLFAGTTQLTRGLEGADLVITGEGSIDPSTLMGKGVGELVKRCQQHKLPCIGLAGIVDKREMVTVGFSQLLGLTPDLTTPDEAQRRAAYWLAKLAERVALEL